MKTRPARLVPASIHNVQREWNLRVRDLFAHPMGSAQGLLKPTVQQMFVQPEFVYNCRNQMVCALHQRGATQVKGAEQEQETLVPEMQSATMVTHAPKISVGAVVLLQRSLTAPPVEMLEPAKVAHALNVRQTKIA